MDIFYGKDIPELFPKPDFWYNEKIIEPDAVYAIGEFNYRNNHIEFEHCNWLKVRT